MTMDSAPIYASDEGCNTDGSASSLPPRSCGVAGLACGGRLAGVRCCSNDGTSCASYCTNTCSLSTLESAVRVCMLIGKRLCTHDELWSRCCGTGCGLDSLPVWTTLPAPPPAPPPPQAIRSATLWLDTEGNHLRAHAASLLHHAGEFFMYGVRDRLRIGPLDRTARCR
jgi:hypothetical protein